jgi:hypothetical protein
VVVRVLHGERATRRRVLRRERGQRVADDFREL